MHLLNLSTIPPFRWINQWSRLPHWRCGGAFTPIALSIQRSHDNGLHVELIVMILGLGFAVRWYDRNERARYLAMMDQVEAEVLDAVRGMAGDGEDE